MLSREHLNVAGRVAVRTLPYLAGILVTNVHPAFAAIGNAGVLAPIGGLATNVGSAASAIGIAGAVSGVALAGFHHVRHSDDLMGTLQRAGGGMIGGFLAGNAVGIAGGAIGGASF